MRNSPKGATSLILLTCLSSFGERALAETVGLGMLELTDDDDDF